MIPSSPAPPRIVHLIDELKVGGAQTHLLTMLEQSIARRPSVEHLVVSLFGEGDFAARFRDAGFPVEVLDLRPLLARRRFLSAVGALETLLRRHRPGLVEAHLTWSRLLGLYAAWKAGIPRRIAFEHGDTYLNSWKFRAANRVGQLFADRIIVCSQALADWNRRTHGISRHRLLVMHNSIDIARFSHPKFRSRPLPFNRPSASTLFAAVGTLGRGVNKRVDVLVRALASARSQGADVGLVICGDGDQRPGLEALSESLGVASSVRFLGTRNDVPDVLAACDAFCHAAPFEPFGIVCVEALAAGLPVLVPDSGGIREIVQPGVTGEVYPALDHDALASSMLRLHQNPLLRLSMGQAARCSAEENFSIVPYVQSLHAIYGLEPSR